MAGRFPSELGTEISGVAVSAAHEGFWLVDDEPGTSQVHLVAVDGTPQRTVSLTGVETVNVEDLAVGPCPGDPADPCVHIADIGDNVAARERVTLLSFPEAAATDAVEVEPGRRTLRYEGGPVDAEALVVAPDGTVLIVDRTPDVAGIHVAAPGEDVLRRVADLTIPAPERPLLSLVAGRVVTAADLRPDGAALLLRTYDQILELVRPTEADDWTTIGSWDVVRWAAPFEPQGEAIAYLDADSAVTVSESSTAITVVPRP